MADFGNTSLQLLLLISTWSGALALVAARRRSPALLRAAQLSLYASALVASTAVVILAYAFAVSDFALTYVQRYSDSSMPLFYKLTAVWGGQEGSLLFWSWLLALMSAVAVRANRERLRDILPHAMVVMALVQIFFCLLLLLVSNPFDLFLASAPAEGRGLNPLLQNSYMVTHPPALYIGYVGMTIPFAFAMAALIAGRTDDSWIQAARPWALASWYFLTMGLVLGMLWAYEELGWGGYWAWDPVENAGLIPWLTATAYLHSVLVQERRGMLKIWNVTLAALTFELTIFGTFLTRSGMIQSVHAFAQSDIGYYFLIFMGTVLTFSTALIVWRRGLLTSRGELESVASREFSFVLNNWVLLSAALLVIVLTIFPSISQIFGNKVTISAPAFNRWMVPIGLTLLALKGIGPMIGWRRSTAAGLRKQFLFPVALGGLAVAVLVALGLREPLPLITFGLSVFVLGTILLEVSRGVMVRRRATGADPFTALLGLFDRNRRRYGGYLVHAGVAFMFIGFGGEAYKTESEVQLARGQRARVGDYSLRYDGTKVEQDEQKIMTTATLSVYRGEERLGTMRPARWVYLKHEGQPTTEVDIRRTIKEDLFVALGSYDEKTEAATFKAVVNPLVNLIWIGFILLSLGSWVALFPGRASRRTAATVAGLLLVLSLGLPGAALADDPARAAAPRGPAAGETIVPIEIQSDHERHIFSKVACMCPTCPPIPLSTCQCGFAANERDAIRKKLRSGWKEEQILRWYLDQRGPELGRQPFGAAALTTPPDTLVNRLSWLLPYLLSGLAVVALVLAGRRWTRTSRLRTESRAGQAADPSPSLDPEARKAYEQLLEQELRKLD